MSSSADIDIVDKSGEIVRPRQKDLELRECTDVDELNYSRHSNGDYIKPCINTSSLVRRNKWYNHRLNSTLSRYESQQRRMLISHNWQQQQFFISQVFDRTGRVRYSQPSSKIPSNLKKYAYSEPNPSDLTDHTSTVQSKSMALLRDGLFNSSSTSVPANVLRHQAMVKRLNLQEKLEQEHMKDLARTRLPSVVKLSPADKEKYKWKTLNDQQHVLLKKASDQIQKKSVVKETRNNIFMGHTQPSNRRLSALCDDKVLWQIVANLPTKLMKTAYQSGYKLIEERQRKFIQRNKRRIEELKTLSDDTTSSLLALQVIRE